MLPSIGDESDYGSLAQKMLDDLFNPSVDDNPENAIDDEIITDPPSPSPGGDAAGSQLLVIGLESPVSVSAQIEGVEDDKDGI